ncbi:MAG: hypothetical protein KDA25_05615, partial [Phycisphaerales bacterium]|nr:hypothetical protein [Phycisphaerales bacterium]
LRDDPYRMTLAAIDECVRNLVCVGTDPSRIAILDNFCWPGCQDAERLGSLVLAAEACYDGAMAYRTPFISGKDSLNNQFTAEDGRTIRIPPTLLISGFGIVPDIARCRTMDAKRPGRALVLVGATDDAMGGSHFGRCFSTDGMNADLPRVDLTRGPAIAQAVHRLIRDGHVHAAHDCSDGGLLVAAAEMAFAGDLGLALDADAVIDGFDPFVACFAESTSRYLLEVDASQLADVARILGPLPHRRIGTFDDSGHVRLTDGSLDESIVTLKAAWQGTLDW